MILRVDPSSAIPPYEQIRGQVAAIIASGALPVGQRLPTIRQLAADLGLAGGTVARAYRELEREGFITSRGRHGTFVADRPAASKKERERALMEAAGAFAMQAAQLGVDPQSAMESALKAFKAQASP